MIRYRLAIISCFLGGVGAVTAADATTTVDYTQRNDAFAPGTSVTPQKEKPATNNAVQEKRVEKTPVEKKISPLAERQAPVNVREAQPKQVREKDSQRPETRAQPTSSYNHREAGISTASDTTKPPTVAKYQDSLSAASATNMARFPAMDRATTAKINRFVFRKNPSEPSAVVGHSPVTPAAGGSVLQK